MVKTVERYMEQHQMIVENDVIVAGVSGGADSVCLFLLLTDFCKKKDAKLVVVHVNHGIRPDASKDAEYVKQLCEEFGVPFHLYERNIEKMADEQGIGTEEAGRKARYEAFAEVLELYGGNGKIAVAHNKGDQAETVLFHLFRGSNVAGLSGIAPVRDHIIRPLLCVERREIEAFLKDKGRSFCIDSTNEENTYTRNKIRNVVLPYVEKEVCTRAVSHIVETADELMKLRQYLELQVKEIEKEAILVRDDRVCLVKKEFQNLHEVMKKQLIVRALECLVPGRKDIGSVHIADIMDLFSKESGKQIHLPYGLLAENTYEWIVLRKKKERSDETNFKVSIPGKLDAGEGIQIEFSLLSEKNCRKIPRKTYTKWFDYDKIKNCLELRNRKVGDYLIITDSGNRKTIKEYFIEEKIPREEREEILLLADGEHVLWVIGKRISEYYKVTMQTKNILQVTVLGKEE